MTTEETEASVKVAIHGSTHTHTKFKPDMFKKLTLSPVKKY
jgi:hypothetical protein